MTMFLYMIALLILQSVQPSHSSKYCVPGITTNSQYRQRWAEPPNTMCDSVSESGCNYGCICASHESNAATMEVKYTCTHSTWQPNTPHFVSWQATTYGFSTSSFNQSIFWNGQVLDSLYRRTYEEGFSSSKSFKQKTQVLIATSNRIELGFKIDQSPLYSWLSNPTQRKTPSSWLSMVSMPCVVNQSLWSISTESIGDSNLVNVIILPPLAIYDNKAVDYTWSVDVLNEDLSWKRISTDASRHGTVTFTASRTQGQLQLRAQTSVADPSDLADIPPRGCPFFCNATVDLASSTPPLAVTSSTTERSAVVLLSLQLALMCIVLIVLLVLYYRGMCCTSTRVGARKSDMVELVPPAQPSPLYSTNIQQSEGQSEA
eukprot:m.9044 g.9044  ORF g.9044 m.9044 type:complete len:374 (+) comp9350_c0_seq1:25-1146(+)